MTYEIQTLCPTNGWQNIGWVIYPDGTEGPLQYDNMDELYQDLDEMLVMGKDPAKLRIAELEDGHS
jgi:hypothetical protein